MQYQSLRYRKFVYKALSACLGGLLLGGLGATSVSAKLTPTDLLEAVNRRASETPAEISPATSAPDIVTPALSAVQQTAEQPLKLLLRLSDRKVYVYRGDQLEASYPVAIGRPGWETPTGEFEVFSQIVDPGWTNPITGESMAPGQDNPLGDRWIAFWTDGTNSIGFHGTPDRDSVGQAASHGCIRMYNEDVQELFDMVALGTPVIVEP